MERNFSNRDFERYVQKNADQYRMFPSEKVWKGVHNSLHKRRRWYGFGLAFLLLLTGTAVTMVMRSYPVSKKQSDIASTNPSTTNNLTAGNADKTEKIAAADIRDLIPFEESTREMEAAILEQLLPQPAAYSTSSNLDNSTISENTEAITATGLMREMNESRNNSITAQDEIQLAVAKIAPVLYLADYPRQKDNKTVEPAIVIQEEAQSEEFIFPVAPYTIESVINSFKPGPKKVSWQLFFTPTVSYRVLSANKEFSGSQGGAIGGLPFPFASLEDVNKAVTHKPDIGFQLGLMARYPISKRINLRVGAQVNINKYDIKAFAYPGEVALINLDDPNSTTVATWTQYRSQNGYKSDWLKNYYLSVSLPVGAEVNLFGNKKTNVGIAGTIQPTYVVRDRAYLISTDYKNYAKVPWLIRRVNISTGFEAFVNYGKGKTRWQVGPQVRYQLLSSFQNKYPVKENLFDFGIKIGVTLNP